MNQSWCNDNVCILQLGRCYLPTICWSSHRNNHFQVYGAVKSLDSQEVLEQLAVNIDRTPEALKDVEVRLCSEPECKYGGSWRRIGYIVHVQDALDTVQYTKLWPTTQ